MHRRTKTDSADELLRLQLRSTGRTKAAPGSSAPAGGNGLANGHSDPLQLEHVLSSLQVMHTVARSPYLHYLLLQTRSARQHNTKSVSTTHESQTTG